MWLLIVGVANVWCVLCRLVKDCSKTSGLQAQAMDSLQEKMKTLQSSIDQEKVAFVQAKVLKLGDALWECALI